MLLRRPRQPLEYAEDELREPEADRARFTGYTLDGGYAEYAIADERFCFEIPEPYTAEEAAPLLCAGLIGYRAYRMAGDARRIGFYGFGSSAQILAQIAKADGREVFAFTRDGDGAARRRDHLRRRQASSSLPRCGMWGRAEALSVRDPHE